MVSRLRSQRLVDQDGRPTIDELNGLAVFNAQGGLEDGMKQRIRRRLRKQPEQLSRFDEWLNYGGPTKLQRHTKRFNNGNRDKTPEELTALDACRDQLHSIQQRERKTLGPATVDLGRVLLEARELLGNNGDGVYCRWLKDDVGMDRSTAAKMILAYRHFGHENCRRHLQFFDRQALYDLSKDGVPAEARQKALELAAESIVVSAKWVKRTLNAIQPERTAKVIEEQVAELDDDWEDDEVAAPPKPEPPPRSDKRRLDRLKSEFKRLPPEARRQFLAFAKRLSVEAKDAETPDVRFKPDGEIYMARETKARKLHGMATTASEPPSDTPEAG